MAYRSGFYSTMLEIYRFNLGLGFVRAIKGLGGFARYFEYPLALQALPTLSDKMVLDVGSSAPLLPLFMASKGADVTMVDIEAKAMRKVQQLADRMSRRIKQPRTVVCDARHLKYPDQTFDIITCISMIEHPPDNGDSNVMAEIGRVLKEGGTAFVDFPYGQTFSVNRLGTLRPWQEADGFDKIERRYDLPSIANRLVNPSGLQVVQQEYALGGRLNHLTAGLNALGTRAGKLARLWSWFYVLLAYTLARFDNPTAGNAEFAYLVLRKPKQNQRS